MKVSAHEESPACMEVGTAELGGLDYRAPRTEKRCTLPGSWEAGWSSERLFSLFFMVPSRFRIQLEDLKVNDPPRSLMEVGGMPSPGSSLKESSVPNLIPQPISFQRDSGELSWHYGWTRTRMSPSSRGLKAMRQSMQEEKQKRLLNPRRSQRCNIPFGTRGDKRDKRR
ncbi:uncharacterized protein LOC117200499 isoform X2 [Orcinus orca]|uniref:uncharacterized protein LOC117200499 isoform X2 n=1 Tax=Orcinus orca TaxID=9733 RepID=UPI001441EA6F|nr:uncharacterized protein LOC117200499 isoform X2 [Orcinus orca]